MGPSAGLGPLEKINLLQIAHTKIIQSHNNDDDDDDNNDNNNNNKYYYFSGYTVEDCA